MNWRAAEAKPERWVAGSVREGGEGRSEKESQTRGTALEQANHKPENESQRWNEVRKKQWDEGGAHDG